MIDQERQALGLPMPAPRVHTHEASQRYWASLAQMCLWIRGGALRDKSIEASKQSCLRSVPGLDLLSAICR